MAKSMNLEAAAAELERKARRTATAHLTISDYERLFLGKYVYTFVALISIQEQYTPVRTTTPRKSSDLFARRGMVHEREQELGKSHTQS